MPLNHSSQYAELTDEHFKIIGQIVIEWSNIEFLLGILLSRLLITPEYLARTYTDNLSAVKLQEAIKDAVEIHKKRYSFKLISEIELEQITKTNNLVTSLRATRNKFAHFCWSRNNDNEIFGTNFSGGAVDSKKHKKSCIIFTISELTNFYQEAYSLVDTMSSIIKNLPQMEEDGLSNKVTMPQENKN